MFILKLIEWLDERREKKIDIEIEKHDVYFSLSIGLVVLLLFVVDKVI